ncbi:hypothetical protein F5883DRAFT_541468 [Diaporthe sp. PMI_573]|nr:hypothetical protein F5883DRAFT_541468 [Diaporthaceae sp. PMI_573]
MSSVFNYSGNNRATSEIPPHILNAPNTPIIQRSVPVRYDPRVVVKPSPPHRVPRLPVQILYLVAQALPQPKWVFNLARVDKESWVYLQPALYECEVTYEARIAHKLPCYDRSVIPSYTLQEECGYFVQMAAEKARRHGPGWDSDSNSDSDSGENDAQTDLPLRAFYAGCKQSSAAGQCDECEGRIDINIDEMRVYDPIPNDLLETNRRGMTALHWASIRGASALPVALKALRSAQAHQPSYIDGVGLKKRKYGRSYVEHFRAELPPPLFLAVAHGNVAVCKALIVAGCDVNLLQGQSVCVIPLRDEVNFKIHKKCVRLKRRFGSTLKCVC